MNFSLYLFGTPGGYRQYPADLICNQFGEFGQNRQSDARFIIYRKDRLIYYVYFRHGLLSKSANEDAYLGISMVFNGVCFIDVKGIHELFKNLYSQMVSKEEIIKEDRTGKIIYNVKNFIEKEGIVADCKAFLQGKIDRQFSKKGRDYIELDSSFDQTNTTTKRLLFNAENSEIINAIRKYGEVILYTPEVLGERRVIINNSVKLKKTKWISPLPVAVVVILAILILIFSYQYKTSATVKSNEVKSISIMSNSIVGEYSCTMDSPQEKRLRIEITYDTSSHRYWGKLSNYNYKDKMISEFFFDTQTRKLRNEILGQGQVAKNSYGDIEIISTAQNEKKWKMRKIQ